MSVMCGETERAVGIDDESYFAATHPKSDQFTSLSTGVVDRIPKEERRAVPAELGDTGINIHEATGNRLLEMTLGRFLFSVSRETAEQYFPRVSRMY